MKTMSKNKYFLRLVTVVISVILIFSTIGLSTGDQVKFNSSRDVTYLSVVPTSQTVGYGETFSIIVHLNPGEPVIGVQIDLSFDPTLVQVDSVSKADPIWDFFGPPIIDNDAGEITGAGVAVFGTTVTTPTDCFNITFTAQNIDGTSPLTLHDVIVTDQNAEPINPIITNGEVIVGGPINLPPEFGAPSPTNGSTGQPLSFTWSIPISDPEGDSFDWSIECNNGQTNSGSDASNGTKTLTLSGLDYLTTYTVWVNATDSEGSGEYTRAWYIFTTEPEGNLPPNTPNKPSGTKLGLISTTYTYTTSAIDPNNDQVYYMWNWGDGSQSNWLGPFNSGQLTQANHAWTNKGLYQIKVKAKDVHGAESDWSEAFTVTMFQSVFFIGSIRNVNKTGDYITFEPKLVLGFWSQPFKVNIYTSGLMLVSKDSSGFVGDRFIFGRFYATPSVPINVIDFVSETTFNDAKPVDIQPYLNR